MKLFAYHLDDPKNTNETFETDLEFLGWSFLTDLERWAFAAIDEKCEVPIFGSDAEEIIRIWERVQGVADGEKVGSDKGRGKLTLV